MLAVNHYSSHYIQDCNKRIARLLERYQAIAQNISDAKALAAFETDFYNTLVIVLDAMFMNRLLTKAHHETSIYEVRELTTSLLNSEDILLRKDKGTASPTLRLKSGASIRLNNEQFMLLAKTYFREIEQQFFSKA
jgi:hypothetical protein